MYIAPHFQLLQFVRLIDRLSTFNKIKMNRLIKSVCFRVRTKKVKHGKYSLKVNSGKYSAWCMKII